MKAVVITGASSGIGFEIARLLSKNYFVIGIGRNENNCAHAKELIYSENPGAKIEYFIADLVQQKEVNRVAYEIQTYLENNDILELYGLINNAGCVRSWYTTSEEGYEQQFALNHLAGFLLTYRLLPLIIKAKGRIIMTGSQSHKGIKICWDDIMLRKRYNPLTAYKQSKLCNILFAKGLNDRFTSAGIRAYVVDPGLVRTDIGNKQAGFLVNLIWSIRKKYGVSPEIPAKTYEFLLETNPAPKGLYYCSCNEKTYSRQVTSENADRLFLLSEKLSGISYDRLEC
ncbi:MAG: SDR family NAD(P)-dependent oxidoreductase [Clostridiaceae bacterium]|nr:SDR family NAD(P)-dependent oxidoreductase [Clostridiaceae bacterium]